MGDLSKYKENNIVMEIPNLSTDFKDDVLDTEVNQIRKYQMIYNPDGTVSFKDVTEYKQIGSLFGAKEVNEERKAINGIYNDRITDIESLKLTTESGFFVDALAVKELTKDYIVEQGKQLIPNTNRYNYYEKYASGKLVQWGIANCSYTDGYGIIKYAIPFAGSTKDYVLFAQGQYISGKVVEVMVASKHSTSQGYAYSRGLNGANIDTHDFDWYAIGKWK